MTTEAQRRVLLDGLDLIDCPAEHAELVAYATAFAEQVGELPAWADLVAAESAAFGSGQSHDIWLCPALSGTARPDPAYLTRSDWPLADRLVGVALPGGRSLWMVRAFCDLYSIATEDEVGDIAPLGEQIRRHATSAGGFLPAGAASFLDEDMDDWDEEMLEQLREAAEDAYADVAADERTHREDAVAKLGQLTRAEQLFGR